MMTYLKNFLLFWYDFMVGDDWMIAAGVVMALVLSAALARRGSERLVGDACDRRCHAGGLALAGDAPVAIAQLRLARRHPDITGARWRCATRETAPVSGYEYHYHTAVLTDVCTVV